ncbi:glycerophosphodiester phosphodiesterase family protein [Maritimibacter sp. DP1N21-5]|uniref:glycerophosphodiester phosphodiesterase family protein n=1 Tax=Maritimibacter sp. DP1N21-5 TaxID=2836867 RepID=UPI001C482C63|nr:glycerophosphodiester phosphodiesterase family protein [Maritimibacter sp. DP1N21-5]MBV7410810.1 phosphodiesterase [Maritimibacter sp. DP1N21-5]
MTPSVPLPDAFLKAPIAHRAYHDKARGRPENAPAAIRAALEAGYGIEVDIQPSRDGVPMVFHDYDLGRLTHETGPVAQRTSSDLRAIRLKDSRETIPTLAEVLEMVGGRAPLLIEIKDQDGALGPNVGPLEAAVAAALMDYEGPVAVMSFNPHAVAALARLAPHIPRGLTTCAFAEDDWPLVKADRLAELAAIPDYDRVGASFISHDATDLSAAPVSALKARGVPVLCWTVKSLAQETQARDIADNVTFERYRAPLGG